MNAEQLQPYRQPVASWIGRLIFPTGDQRQNDSVQFEVHQTADGYKHLLHHVVTLQWSSDPDVQEYIRASARDVHFTPVTEESIQKGRIHPIRLNHLAQIGPLESLAGARLEDDMWVALPEPVIVLNHDLAPTEHAPVSGAASLSGFSLTIRREPIQITGHVYSLITIRQRIAPNQDLFEVQHYNPASKQFDGPQEQMRIPQVPEGQDGIPQSTNRDIEQSPANAQGWYVFGHHDVDGVFVVQSIEPRATIALHPDRVLLGQSRGLTYLSRENWYDTPAKKGTVETVLVDPCAGQSDEAIAQWQEGDKAIVIHLFGGIGGSKRDERGILGLVKGHFAYGTATVIKEPLTQDLCFDVEYRQVYANNTNGIISGTIKRFCYIGDLKRGWLGTRPVSDIIVKLDLITRDYNLGGFTLSPLTEFLHQLDRMTARYRVGNGTGASIVTPARSCVQDSNQALYIALDHIEDQIKADPTLQEWLDTHPDDPETCRFRELQSLGRALNRDLAPIGIVRADWKRNADEVAGAPQAKNWLVLLFRILTSWQTMLPRRGHDEIARTLLNHGAKLWFIRTNQVGGHNPDIIPYAPTTILGRDRDLN